MYATEWMIDELKISPCIAQILDSKELDEDDVECLEIAMKAWRSGDIDLRQDIDILLIEKYFPVRSTKTLSEIS
jgi:hypothetical protein